MRAHEGGVTQGESLPLDGLGALAAAERGGCFLKSFAFEPIGLCSAAAGAEQRLPAGAADGSAPADAERKGLAPCRAVGQWQGQHWEL